MIDFGDRPDNDSKDESDKHDVGPGGDAACSKEKETREDEMIFQHGQTWYKCIPCNKPLNTKEQLWTHQQSPKHQKIRERWKAQGSMVVDIPKFVNLPASANMLRTDSTETTGDELVIVGGQPKFRCHACSCNVDTKQMLEIHKRSPKHLKAADRMQMAAAVGSVQTLGLDRTVWHTCHVCGKKLNSAQQLQTHLQSHGLAPGGLTTDFPARASTGVVQNLMDKFSPFKANIDDIDVVPAGTPLKQHMMKEKEHERSGRRVVCDMVDSAEAPLQAVGPEGDDTAESAQLKTDTVGSNIERKRVAADIVVRLDDMGNLVGEDNTGNSNHGNMVCDTPTRDAQDSLTNEMKDLTLENTTEDTNHDPMRGTCWFLQCFYHCAVCDTHLGGPAPKKDHMDSFKHLKNLKKKGLLGASGGSTLVADGLIPIIEKPISPNTPFGFYNYCDICKVPFSGPEAQAAHERGKLHKAKAAKSNVAPTRKLPDIVKHPCADNTDVYVLTKTEPRSYQVELYMKTVAADSVIFLPTGKIFGNITVCDA